MAVIILTAKLAQCLFDVFMCSGPARCSGLTLLPCASAIQLTANCAKTANKKGSVPSSYGELKNGVFSPWEKKTGEPSRVWVWISTGGLKRSVRCNLCSYRSRCSRFMFLKRSVPSNSGGSRVRKGAWPCDGIIGKGAPSSVFSCTILLGTTGATGGES